MTELERLEIENLQLLNELNELKEAFFFVQNELQELKTNTDNLCLESLVYKELQAEFEQLEKEFVEMKQSKEQTKPVLNERGAGRKPRFTDHEKALIKMYRGQDKTFSELAAMFNCSIGLIHKVLNEKE